MSPNRFARGRQRVLCAAVAFGFLVVTCADWAQGPAQGQGKISAQQFLESIPQDASILGRFKPAATGTLSLVPEADRQLSIPVARPSQVPKALQGVPMTLTVRRIDGEANIAAASLPIFSQSRQLPPSISARNPNLVPSFEYLEQRFSQIFPLQMLQATPQRAPAEPLPAQLRAFNDAAVAAEDEIVKTYRTLGSGDGAERDRLLDLFHDTIRTRKAIYGRSDLYRPLVYQRIHEASRGAVAVVEKNPDRVRCSGVLIGRDIVLTALHCLSGVIVSAELKVWFNFEKDLAEPPNNFTVTSFDVKEVVLEGAPLPQTGAGRMDYALLRLRPDATNAAAGDKFAARCLSPDRVRYDQPLYVVGHPRGEERTVHDNGWVIFPFLITREEYDRLLMLTDLEYRNSPDRDAILASFKASYVASNEAGQEVFRNFSARWGYQPTIGVEVDTFHGNSGGPAFGRVDQRIVGILIDGEPDEAQPWTPGWRRHEVVLPATQMIADIQARQPALISNKDINICGP